MHERGYATVFVALFAAFGFLGLLFFVGPIILPTEYETYDRGVVPAEQGASVVKKESAYASSTVSSTISLTTEKEPVRAGVSSPVVIHPTPKRDASYSAAVHIATPSPLRAIYMTSWVAATPRLRSKLVALARETEINAIIIDIKDYSGRVAFYVDDPLVLGIGSIEERVADIREFIAELHRENIYVIGRITVFQDPYLATVRPDLAVKTLSDTSVVWKDYKGLSFIDVSAREAWEYIIALSKASYEIGFDELNYDYIRFPSDGPMQDIYYPWSNDIVAADWDYGKAHALREFFEYLRQEMEDTGAVTSADIFGMTTTNRDDLNIGQLLEDALLNFDYVAPMVYPSHYPKTFRGYAKPAEEPYGVIKFSMDSAVVRAKQLEEYGEATTTLPTIGISACAMCRKLRPWLQDFDLGATYDAAKVKAQMVATYDAGLDSWMLWDPANTYTRAALEER